MKTKQKVIKTEVIINMCRDCKFKVWVMKSNCWCCRFDLILKNIKNIATIPKWCKLEDYKEGD